MPILKADNRTLLENAPFSYLATNYASGALSVTVLNPSKFEADQYVLLGGFGSQTSELLKVKAVTGSVLTFKDEFGVDVNLSYPHSESSRIYIIPYNQVKFYHTVAPTFAVETTLATEEIQPYEFFTSYEDTSFIDGYGWFKFYNSQTTELSSVSNVIPYSGFELTTAKKIMDDFFSLLNNKELKLITANDAFTWMNEGYSIIKNELNLVDTGISASEEIDLNITAGTAEYDLPSDFSKLIYIRSNSTDNSVQLTPIPFSDIPAYLGGGNTTPRYYIRGSVIGFVPTPSSDTIYKFRHQAKITPIDSYDDIVDLPDNGHYAVKDFMLFRAYQKLTNPNSSVYHANFKEYLGRIKNVSISRDNYPDSFGLVGYANT